MCECDCGCKSTGELEQIEIYHDPFSDYTDTANVCRDRCYYGDCMETEYYGLEESDYPDHPSHYVEFKT